MARKFMSCNQSNCGLGSLQTLHLSRWCSDIDYIDLGRLQSLLALNLYTFLLRAPSLQLRLARSSRSRWKRSWSIFIRDTTMLDGPPELHDAFQGGFSYTALPTCGNLELMCLGRGRHGDYAWGFKIYRTI